MHLIVVVSRADTSASKLVLEAHSVAACFASLQVVGSAARNPRFHLRLVGWFVIGRDEGAQTEQCEHGDKDDQLEVHDGGFLWTRQIYFGECFFFVIF